MAGDAVSIKRTGRIVVPGGGVMNRNEISNEFMVGIGDGGKVISFRLMNMNAHMSRAAALNLAAWIVVLADPLGKEFSDLIERVQNT